MPLTPHGAVAVIGAGFSGSVLAIQLRRRLPPGREVLLIERGDAAGRGLAYGTTDPHHLLNVAAKSMSADPDDPGQLLRWLQAQPAAAFGPLCAGPGPDAFVPRRLFGAYLREQLDVAIAQGGIRLLRTEVDTVAPLPGGGFRLAGPGLAEDVAQVVLATGNPPPGGDRLPWLAGDPWNPGALEGLAPDAPLLLVGAGLTMADLVLTLRRSRGHRGPIHVVSRHGWAPLPHADPLPTPWPVPAMADGTPLSVILRTLRAAYRDAAAAGHPWQAVIDGFRPQVQRLWRGMSPDQRRRFGRHARTLWGVHRHRLAPAVATAVAASDITLRAARLTGWEPAGDGVRATVTPRGGTPETLDVARILLCVGPGEGRGWMAEPPIAGLLAAGLVQPDLLGVGMVIDPDTLAVIGADGAAVPGLFALGPALRAVLWEATAVPELREMAGRLAERLSK